MLNKRDLRLVSHDIESFRNITFHLQIEYQIVAYSPSLISLKDVVVVKKI